MTASPSIYYDHRLAIIRCLLLQHGTDTLDILGLFLLLHFQRGLRNVAVHEHYTDIFVFVA